MNAPFVPLGSSSLGGFLSYFSHNDLLSVWLMLMIGIATPHVLYSILFMGRVRKLHLAKMNVILLPYVSVPCINITSRNVFNTDVKCKVVGRMPCNRPLPYSVQLEYNAFYKGIYAAVQKYNR